MAKYKWDRIWDPDGTQKKLFDDSEGVYVECFQPQHREDFQHFRDYILDAEKNRRRKKKDRPIDGYWVGCIASEVQGMALVTGYPMHRLGFISYFGVLESHTLQGKRLAGIGMKELENEFWQQGIDAILTEVEKINIEDLEARRTSGIPDKWLQMRWNFLKSLQKRGTRKISFIDYLQPILDVELIGKTREASDLHLMVRYTSPKQRTDRDFDSLDRDTVKRYVEFVYKVFYRDGFDVSDRKEAKMAEEYLAQLSQKVLHDLPEKLERIPLGEVALEPLNLSVMVSYVIGEGTQLKGLLSRYLTDMGAHVVEWGKEIPRAIGDSLIKTVFGLVHKADVVVALLTPGFLASQPMQGELQDAVKLGKHIIPLVDCDTDEVTKKKIVQLLKKTVGSVTVYMEYTRKEFDQAVYAVRETLVALLPPVH